MVSKTLPRDVLFSWSTNFDWIAEDGDIYIWWHTPEDSYKVKLDAASATKMRGVVQQIKTWMATQDTWSGTVTEHHQLQDVTVAAKTEKQWVQVTP
jgi:DNA phosphorothioation-dependent restriction protein DptG